MFNVYMENSKVIYLSMSFEVVYVKMFDVNLMEKPIHRIKYSLDCLQLSVNVYLL